jgi:hypothetical protein
MGRSASPAWRLATTPFEDSSQTSSQGVIQRAAAFSTANVTVNGTDLTDVILQPQSPITISGRLTGEASTLAADQAIDPRGSASSQPVAR